MKGAREYAGLFKTGQYGRFYIVSSSHARGRTFHIQVLPENEEAVSNGVGNLCLNGDAVEVYGSVSGRPGWTEEYGWLHKGAWCDDFYAIVEKRRDEFTASISRAVSAREDLAEIEATRVDGLLSSYVQGVKEPS